MVTRKAGSPRTQLPDRLLCATLHTCVLADPLGQGSYSLMFYRGGGEAQVGGQTSMSPHKWVKSASVSDAPSNFIPIGAQTAEGDPCRGPDPELHISH